MRRIIFDFDGTIADSLPVAIEIAKEVLGLEPTKEEIELYRNMTAKQILKVAKIPFYRLPRLIVKGRALIKKRTNEIKIFEGFEEIINQLSNEHKLYVVSSNGASVINEFLVKHNILNAFSGVFGNVGVFSKAQALKKVMAKEGFSSNQAVYVGDEVRDIEAAKKVKIPIIAVTWGYNGEKIINSYSPDFVALKPTDIKNFIHELS